VEAMSKVLSAIAVKRASSAISGTAAAPMPQETVSVRQ
jgi:hypothetical protein